MLRAPSGMESLRRSGRHVSKLLPCAFCLQIVDEVHRMCSPRCSVSCCSVVRIALLLLVKVLLSQVGRL